ncbi:bacterial transcriptional activator domain-containing protein [Kitasatospora sp. NBC_01250]|uniref:AfsR/SARP family transcriptional regulator n=1 Tax=Kitasatospora sp. NBC_01250 TaxID=2903571 RepID=UPI002E2F4633|nr:bacterial transcriptional activator domain-containing protein [Kitasatospora sp. NBC_01250]
MRISLSLLPSFSCRSGLDVHTISPAGQRILAAAALEDGPISRDVLTTRLWPDLTASRASARLRQGLWRLNRSVPGGGLLTVSSTSVALADDVHLDYRAATDLYDTWACQGIPHGELRKSARPWCSYFKHPLLAGWDEEWLTPGQEQWDTRRLRALEDLSRACLDAGELLLATEVADTAAEVDPLREGPRRIAIEAMVRAGEIATAHRRYQQFEQQLDDELGIRPSPATSALLRTPARLVAV